MKSSYKFFLVILCTMLVLGFIWLGYLYFWVYFDQILSPKQKFIAYWKPSILIFVSGVLAYSMAVISEENNII